MEPERIAELLEQHSKPSRKGTVQLLKPDEEDPNAEFIVPEGGVQDDK